MKRILITGANSYIGTYFENYITKKYSHYQIDTVDMTVDSWREKDFSLYDTIFHVAGLAHANPKPEMKDLYYKVNTDLAVETAKKAKKDGAGQFIFMSSIIVFGSKHKIIDSTTIPAPENFYGNSKLKADTEIHKLQDESFMVVSLRPPMIYGSRSKGNYQKLSKYIKFLPFFPEIHNKRSMLYIENLCEFIKLMIDNKEHGIFYPQNKEYVSTLSLASLISQISKGKKLKTVRIFNPLLRVLKERIVFFNKLFGDLYYEKDLSDYDGFKYCVCDFKDSIERTESLL